MGIVLQPCVIHSLITIYICFQHFIVLHHFAIQENTPQRVLQHAQVVLPVNTELKRHNRAVKLVRSDTTAPASLNESHAGLANTALKRHKALNRAVKIVRSDTTAQARQVLVLLVNQESMALKRTKALKRAVKLVRTDTTALVPPTDVLVNQESILIKQVYLH